MICISKETICISVSDCINEKKCTKVERDLHK